MFSKTFLVLVLFLPACNSSKKEPGKQIEPPQTISEQQKPAQYSGSPQVGTIDYLMGKFEPAQHPDFAKVEKKHADREGLFLRKDTYEAFQKMYLEAKKSGVDFIIRSATRNFDYQKQIWEKKWTGKTKIENGKDASEAYPDAKVRALKILEFSSMPGTSRHHWGTDLDLNSFSNEYFEKGTGLEEYEWLKANAPKFGFCQPYSEKGTNRPFGYNEEKWHWSYLPVAKKLTAKAKVALADDQIKGFKGAETAKEIGVVEKYVLGINQECL